MREEDLKEVADLLVNPNTIELGLKLLEDRFGFEIVFRSMGNDEWRKFWNQHKYSIFLLIGDFRVRLTYVDENILIKLYNYLYDIDITKCHIYFDEHYASFSKRTT